MKRKRYSNDFKARVAIEALRGEKTIQELSQIHGVHPNMITQWKKHLLDSASEIFNKKKGEQEKAVIEKKFELLYSQIGRLQVERDFLKKKHLEISGTEPEL